MVRGDAAEQERVVARALERGVTYFDTAAAYGDGQSETNLGRVLAKLRPHLLLGTKLRLRPDAKADPAKAIAAGIDENLRRLGRDHVDLYQLHNPITALGDGHSLTPREVIERVLPAFQSLRKHGKTRFLGFTAIGDSDALHEVVQSGGFDTAQVCFNLLNPSAAGPLRPGSQAQDYARLLLATQSAGMGAIGIRALAGGALSGVPTRHPIASPPPEPIGSGPDYQADKAQAEAFAAWAARNGAASLAEAAVRFATWQPLLATTLIGIATVDEFEFAADAVAKGPLSQAALGDLAEVEAPL